MTDIAIRAENLGKLYKIGRRQERYRTLRDTITDVAAAPFRRLRSALRGQSAAEQGETIWALKDVSFEIKQGEVVGIIGRNGAGKSTLLKILSCITEPTQGYAEIHGRVGSLLEVGTGFHPELTGRENIYLNGAILGMKRVEINRKFDEIVAFAEVDKFIDTPVKHYSSGMYMRLAFAVAAHLETEVLLVDEVLAVGDLAFQRKCLGKMHDIAKRGKTVVFVSHNMGAIYNICERAILLSRGGIDKDGSINIIIEKYCNDSINHDNLKPIRDRIDRKGDGLIKFTKLHWKTFAGERVSILRSGENYNLLLDYECSDKQIKNNVFVSFIVKDISGVTLLLHQSDFNNNNFNSLPNKGQFICTIPKLPLVAGQYLINIFVGINNKACDVVEDAAIVTVEYGDFFGTGHLGRPTLCKFLIDCAWEIKSKE